MFQIGQIITSSQFIRNFVKVSKYLRSTSDPILVSQKSGEYLVVMPAESYERLVSENMNTRGMEMPLAYLRNELTAKS